MENIQLSKDFSKKFPKLSLKGYYNALPERSAPKTDFLREIVTKCDGVTETTARNWCLYGIRPKKAEHRRVLSELTGIREEDLW